MVLAPREVISVDLPVEFDTAWAHVRCPQLIHRWYGWGGTTADDGIRQRFLLDASVHLPDPGLPLGWLHWHNHDHLEVRGGWSNTPRSTVTVRRQERALLASYDGVRDAVDEAWITFLHQLRFAVSHHLGKERVSFTMRGSGAEPPDRTLYRAGLHGARGVPLGGAVEVRRPDGSVAGGTLEFSEAHQFGIRLSGRGGSLLVVQLLPPASRPPHGAVNVMWSVWGQDADEIESARRRWSSWWRAPVAARRA